MYRASVENRGNLKFEAETRDHRFFIGLGGEGANPVDTLLAGLCGCIGHYVRDFMSEKKVVCPEFAVKAEARATRNQMQLETIDLFVDLKDTKLEKTDETALLQFVKKCKIHNTLEAGCRINLALI